jgi:hypothetical protein
MSQGQHGVHLACSNRLTNCQGVREMTRVSMESTRHAAATDLHSVNESEKMTRVSMESTRHAATDLPLSMSQRR